MVFSEKILEKEIEAAIQRKAYDTAANLVNAMSAMRCAETQMQNAKQIEETLGAVRSFVESMQAMAEQIGPELARQALKQNSNGLE